MTRQGLTAITIENFKGIGQAVTIPLRPVTLLFGANSAGKSTIIQALQYAWEILENRNADVDRTRLGGEVIDLGGFRNLVHGHDVSQSISITLHYAGGLKDEAYRAPDVFYSPLQDQVIDQWDDGEANVSDWFDIASFSVAVRTAWEPGSGAYISLYEVVVEDSWFARVSGGFNTTPELKVNFHHPLFADEALAAYNEHARCVMTDIKDTFILDTRNRVDEYLAPLGNVTEEVAEEIWRKAEEEIAADPERLRHCVQTVIPFWGSEIFIWGEGGRHNRDASISQKESEWALSQLILGAGEAVLQALRGLRYLGPLRAVPERNQSVPLRPDAARWANGLGAWDSLLRANEDEQDLVGRCNHYLNEVLGLGYTVRRENRIQLPEDHAILSELRLFAAQYDERDGADLIRRVLEPLEALPRVAALQLHDEKREIDIDPMDIGVGVSQTLPVVVGAVEPNCTIFAVEQPELHIHPAVQVGLGDLFLREALSGSRKFLVETHSEHLVLRMMKRMRETCEGTLAGDFPEVTPEDVAILYVETIDGKTYVREMPLNERGELIKAWPGGFFEEALRETF